MTTLAEAPTTGRLFSRPAVAASCVGFILIGALQALYGPAIPALRHNYGLSPALAGLGLSAHFIGGVAGVLSFNAVHGRIGNRALLTLSYGLMAAGSAAFALAPNWPVGDPHLPTEPHGWAGGKHHPLCQPQAATHWPCPAARR